MTNSLITSFILAIVSGGGTGKSVLLGTGLLFSLGTGCVAGDVWVAGVVLGAVIGACAVCVVGTCLGAAGGVLEVGAVF